MRNRWVSAYRSASAFSSRDAWEGSTGYFRFSNEERVHQSLEYLTPAGVFFGK